MKTIKKTPRYILLTLIVSMFTACENYLNEAQDNRTTIDSKNKTLELLVNAYPNAVFAEFAESMSDNADDKGSGASIDSPENEAAYKWEDQIFTGNETTVNYWDASYEAIAHANQALASIAELGGGTDFNGAKGEALLTRAYSHFMLVNFWAMRYDPATAATELGIPYVLEPETEAIKKYSRKTIKEVYELIEKDLTAGLPLINNSDYAQPKFHFNRDAANAFATRFFLYKGDWNKVIGHASNVLDAFVGNKVRDLNAYRSLTYTERSIAYSSAIENANLLITWTNSTYGRKFASNRYALSSSIADSLFSGIGTHPFAKRWAYSVFGTGDFFNNRPKYEEYFKLTNPSAGIGFAYIANVLFTIDEVFLNRAEAYAMKENYMSASADLTTFLAKKTRDFDMGTDMITQTLMETQYGVIADEYTPFYALNNTQASFVKGIAELRRREFYHEGIRWLDVKRFDIEITHAISGESTPIVLPKGDRRRAIEIPESARSFGITSNRED